MDLIKRNTMILARKKNHRYPLVILATICVMYFVENFLRSAPSALTPVLVDEFGITRGMAGLLFSSFSMVYAVMQIPSGFLSMTIGPRRTIMIFTVFAIFGVLLFFASSTYDALLAAQLLIGFGFSVFYINAIGLVTQWFSPERRASAIGVLSAASGLGNFASYIGFPLSAAFAGGWRTLFLYSSVILIINYVTIFFIIRNNPDKGMYHGEQTRSSKGSSIRQVLAKREIYPIIIGYILSCFSWLLLSWLPKMLVDTAGMSYLEAGFVSSMATIAGIPGCIAVALISDHLRSRKRPLVVFSLGYTIILIIFLILPRGTPLIVSIIVATMLGVMISLWVLPISMIPEVLPRDKAGIGLGLMNGLGSLGFSLFAPIYGALVDSYGNYVLSNAIIVIGALSMTAVYVLFVGETYCGLKKAD